MTAAATTTAPAGTRTSGAELDHYTCCDENRALCGTDVTGAPEIDTDATCVVCIDLEATDAPCCTDCPFGST